MKTATRRYVGLWTLLGGAVVAVVLVLDGGVTQSMILPIAGVALLVALAERIELDFVFESETSVYTLIEVALTAALLLVGPVPAVLAGIFGTTVAQATRRSNVTKTLFAVAQASVGMGLASLTLLYFPVIGPLVNGRPVLGAVAGMILYVVVNLTSMIGLLSRAAGPEARAGIRAQVPLTAATMVGQIATGVVLAVIAEIDVLLTPFVLAPAAAVYLAARGATRTTDLLIRVRTERDRLTRVIDGATDGILLLDGTGSIQLWNPAMTRMTGLEPDQAVGRPVAEVLTDELRSAVDPVRGRWLVDEAHGGATRREIEAELTHLDGSRRAISESHALIYDERGRCIGDVVVIRDVSRQQELERLRSDFVARVSHELRTPLTPIRGFVSVLLRRGDTISVAQRTEALERILERAEHLGTLVEDLLLVTRLDQGEFDDLVNPRPILLDDVIGTAIRRALQRDPGRQISDHIAPGTPAALADPDRVVQILDALLDNACQYSPDGTPIEIELDHVHDDLRIRVIDHGPGIPRDRREMVFERFHRLEDPLTMRTSGVGLGLFIARQLAVAMHGGLEVDDQPTGAGACFVLSLPTAEPATGGSEAVS